jgi:hypothetical protein
MAGKSIEECQTAENRAVALRACAEMVLGGIDRLEAFIACLALAGRAYAPLIKAVRAAEHQRSVKVAGEVDCRSRSPDCALWSRAADAVIGDR